MVCGRCRIGPFVFGLIAIQMGRPSKICGSESAGSCLSSAHQQAARVHSSSPSVLPAAGGYLVGSALPHTAGSVSATWRPADDRITALAHDWTIDHLTGQAHRRPSDTWSAQYSDSGTGGLLTDDAGSLEPSPKRRHSDSYASSSSPYQFSPPPSGSGSSVDLGHAGARCASSDGSQRSRQSSMSSQEAAAYHGGGLWGTSPTTTSNLTGPPATTTYGVLRMSGGEMLHGLTGAASSTVTQQDVYMHWNLPLPTTTTTTTSMKLEDTAGAFQAREMSDVIENIIRQQHQQPVGAAATPSLVAAAEYRADSASSLRHHRHHHHQQAQLAVTTTGSLDSLQLIFDPTASTTVDSGSTPAFIPSLPPLAVAAGSGFSSLDAGMAVDASDWINHLSEDLTNEKSSAAESGHASGVRSCDEGPDAEIESQVESTMSYWLEPDLPDENVMLADRHWDVLNRVVPAYNRFVQFGTNVNRKLKIKFDVSEVLCY